MIKFGVQLGGGNSRVKIQPLHIELNEIFRNRNENYFRDIETFGVYFRVEGSVRKFGEEGPSNLEFLKKHKELGIDFVVPEGVWQTSDTKGLKVYFSESVRKCFNILIKEACSRGFVINDQVLVGDFEIRINIFEGKN